MNDIVASAREARQKLAEALALLQAPEAASVVDTVAEPVARAMGALHSIESSAGATLGASGPRALECVREALGALQSAPEIRVVEQATEFVAGSLGLVHSLAQKAALHQAETAKAPDVAPVDFARTAVSAQTPESVRPVASIGSAATMEMAAPPVITEKPAVDQTAFDKTAMASRSPVAHLDAPRAPVQEAPVAPGRPHHDSKHAPAPSTAPPLNAISFEANLGAHSPTNFYKGLSGNDVVDDGGIFVATYKIPPIGAALWLKVTMPGGYEFEASGEVRWTRDSHSGDTPGFGASFRSVSPEARQLIYRYVRNREPLFYDDL